MYKTETHLHVSEISACSRLNAKEMVKLYHQEGYKTLFVSDHLCQKFIDSLGDISWEDKITIFLYGYYKAKEAAKEYDMNVLMAAEIAFVDSHNHYLAYGITKEFLIECVDVCKMNIEEFSKIAKEKNIFLVQAHPFRDRKCYPTLEYVEGMEVYNSNPRHENFSCKALAIAEKHNLYVTSGSDSHRIEDIGKAGILSEEEIKTSEDYIKIIKNSEAIMIKG